MRLWCISISNVVSQETANSGFASNKLGSIWLVRSIPCVLWRCIQLSNPRNVRRTGRSLSLNLIPICPAVSPGRVTNISVAYQDAWFARWHLGRHTDIIEDLYGVTHYSNCIVYPVIDFTRQRTSWLLRNCRRKIKEKTQYVLLSYYVVWNKTIEIEKKRDKILF